MAGTLYELTPKIYELVSHIPMGYVLTYGHLAWLAGTPKNARLAARIISCAPEEVNAHRVVNSVGRTAPGWHEQRVLLEAEGVRFKKNGNVDLKRHLWRSSQW